MTTTIHGCGDTAPTTYECPRCVGHKRIERWSHIANGVCFLCAGAGRVKARQSATRRHARSNRVDHHLIAAGCEWVFRCFAAEQATDYTPGRAACVILSVRRLGALDAGQKRFAFLAHLTVEAARDAYRWAQEGRHVDTIDNAELGLPDRRCSAWDRNVKEIGWN